MTNGRWAMYLAFLSVIIWTQIVLAEDIVQQTILYVLWGMTVSMSLRYSYRAVKGRKVTKKEVLDAASLNAKKVRELELKGPEGQRGLHQRCVASYRQKEPQQARPEGRRPMIPRCRRCNHGKNEHWQGRGTCMHSHPEEAPKWSCPCHTFVPMTKKKWWRRLSNA